MTETELLAGAIDRLAAAIEQGVLAFIVDRKPADPFGPGPLHETLEPLPPVQTRQTLDVCPVHHTEWKLVPAGISKKTGRPYEAFRACSTAGCEQRPPRS